MAISIPVQKELLILDLAEEMVRSGRVNDLPDLLEEGLRTAAQIQIPFLADTFRSSLAAVYVRLFSGTGRESCLQRAGAAISGIIHEEIRVSAAGIHETLQPKIPPLYPEIKRAAEHLVTERYDMAEVLGLENLVRSAQERGAIARYFCSIAIIFNSTGKTRLARRFYDTSLAEAGVIRPLSRRAYVLCDLALMLETAGCTTKAMEVMDRAIDAATGIRQFSDRDEVFDNLAAAMQWMRGA